MASTTAASDDQRVLNVFGPTGLESERRIEANNGAGVWNLRQKTTWDHYANEKLKTMTTTNGAGATVESHTVTYDDPQGRYVNGNRTTDTFTLVGPDTTAACRTATCTNTYTYDAREKLNKQELKNAGGTVLNSTTYTLDNAGNVGTEVSVQGGTTKTKTMGYAGNQMTQVTEAGATQNHLYDTNGNLPTNPFRFSAKRFDSGSGSLDIGARRFGPSTGRFLQQDKYQGALDDLGLSADPLSQNRYSLAGGNPVSFVEADGHLVLPDGMGTRAVTPKPQTSARAHRRSTSTRVTAGDLLGALGDTFKSFGKSLGETGAKRVDEYIAATGHVPTSNRDIFNVGVSPVYRALDSCTGGVTKRNWVTCGGAVAETASWATAGAGLARAGQAGVAAARSASVGDEIAGAATKAAASTGPGQGAVHGTRVHTAFRQELEALGRSDVFSEISYRNGRVVSYGTRGSVRLDAVVGRPEAPSAIYDLKTGSARLTAQRIMQIRSHLPAGFQNVPVLEVRPP